MRRFLFLVTIVAVVTIVAAGAASGGVGRTTAAVSKRVGAPRIESASAVVSFSGSASYSRSMRSAKLWIG